MPPRCGRRDACYLSPPQEPSPQEASPPSFAPPQEPSPQEPSALASVVSAAASAPAVTSEASGPSSDLQPADIVKAAVAIAIIVYFSAEFMCIYPLSCERPEHSVAPRKCNTASRIESAPRFDEQNANQSDRWPQSESNVPLMTRGTLLGGRCFARIARWGTGAATRIPHRLRGLR